MLRVASPMSVMLLQPLGDKLIRLSVNDDTCAMRTKRDTKKNSEIFPSCTHIKVRLVSWGQFSVVSPASVTLLQYLEDYEVKSYVK